MPVVLQSAAPGARGPQVRIEVVVGIHYFGQLIFSPLFAHISIFRSSVEAAPDEVAVAEAPLHLGFLAEGLRQQVRVPPLEGAGCADTAHDDVAAQLALDSGVQSLVLFL